MTEPNPFACDTAAGTNTDDYAGRVAALIETGHCFHARGWSLATSSNYSIVLERDPLRLLITSSGRDKSRLCVRDFLVVGADGQPLSEGGRPSAETLLHVVAAQRAGIGAVLHTHSTWGTVLSQRFFEQGFVEITGYEMLKALPGIETHDATVRIEIVDNTQDIAKLATRLAERLAAPRNPMQFGFLMRGHGLYTWGRDLNAARRHVEALEFLFEVLGRTN